MLKSLHSRLIAAAIAVLLSSGLLAALGSYHAAIVEADEILDAHLAQLVQTLLFLSRANGDRALGDIGSSANSSHSYTVYQIWQLRSPSPEPQQSYSQADDDMRPFPRLILRSGDMGGRSAFERQDGYGDAEFSGRSFRVFAKTSDDGVYRVIAGQDLIDRGEMIDGIAYSNILPFLWIMPLGLLVLVGLIYYSLGPIRRLTAEVSSLQPSLLLPLTMSPVPRELAPLIEALNTLLSRLGQAMEYERRFTGDAAHELRTPIAALRAQLDALRLAGNKEARIQAQQHASATADRLARLVNQLLILGRLDAGIKATEQVCELDELARELCQDMGPSAIQSGIDLSLHALPAPVCGDEEVLRILLRNLLDNALRYTPTGGRVEVSVDSVDGRVRLLVADNGPGVPPERFEILGQRFNRLDQPDGSGVGLGLSIVLRIAQQCQGRVCFGPGLDGRGLAVLVALPGVK